MVETEQSKVCSYCAEQIRALAKVCPHCGRLQNRAAIYIDGLASYCFNWHIGKRKVMSEGAETKPCDYCAEPIRVAAKVCPYCRRLQSPWKLKAQLEAWLSLAFLMMMFLGGIFVLDNIFSPGRDFEKFKNQVVVINPEMHFGQTTNGSFISTIGQIRNGSPYSWKDIQLEVQYFDKDGRMIDTHTENRYGDVTPPGDVQAFRIRSLADKPEAAYVSEKIFVRAAKDSSKWP